MQTRVSIATSRQPGGCKVAAILLTVLVILSRYAAPASAQWTQWGGPNRDFVCDTTKLADAWPQDGPHQVWSREIGGGHSSILVDGGTLYTMCRREGEKDAVLALLATSGETVWETRYDAPVKPDMAVDFGAGPHSTPLIVGDRIFAIGGMVQFHCLDKHTGKILWYHDLMEEMGASDMLRGYGASPIAYDDLIIVGCGAGGGQPGVGLAAFKQETGKVAWRNEELSAGFASPILVKFNGEDHLIVGLGTARAGLDPATGQVRWRTDVDAQSAMIITTPLWIEPDLLFCSASYGGGTRLFKLGFDEGKYHVEELWHYRKMQVAHGTIARVGDVVYASSHGSFSPAILTAIDLKSGKPLWRQRSLTKSNVLYADGKFILLDEEGNLALGTATSTGMVIHSQAKVLERLSWTAPTLVGARLYLRDHHTIKCLDLSPAADN